MKSLLVHFAKDHGEGRLEIAGRCIEEPIFVSDQLTIEGRDPSTLRVLSIEVYGKQEECLHPGYVGNLIMQRSDPSQVLMKLIGGTSKACNLKKKEGAQSGPRD